MFTTTLGIREKTVYNWLNDSESGIPNTEKKDNRGAKDEYKKREVAAREYLNNIPKLESHYCRASSKKKYSEPLFESKNHVFREYRSL
ncbi:hypothetical protein DPMN_014256 [Dreissena polymorpha]|uniref:Uncharacterized protein n=1 Tax=Dreissena polymorpha TaxID=45954 RepID=A0A9D4NAF0_DREPO|nr:hypothetical protein DPMN_014256 [Dreissena polymorpha]